MKEKVFFSWVMILCVVRINAQGEYYTETTPAMAMEDKMTKLCFFYHSVFGGKNPNVVPIAQPKVIRNDTALLPFGTLVAVNNAMRVGIEPTSKIIGRAKGLTLGVSQKDEFTIFGTCRDHGFITGKFSGSSFVLCSRNPIVEPEYEHAVIGGREKLRMATGFAKVQTIFFNITIGYRVQKYEVTLFHY
ncbi:dirigent protein 4 [Ricinus communis]|uniref:Dirigent protein n=1 Tax=Ricinus communis TaxID=3988 RepID=B9RU81_RICCO|nr:dirigent protein 4 [Ricinus communis]EEF45093.1 conserved hypothetical protein [Ricinus communis]|eukprot:XP_002517300.1 dirigent protein 4 [Ricinus communis]